MEKSSNNIPKFEIVDGKFLLLEDFKYVFEDGKYIEIVKGYETNYASIPALARWLISPIDSEIVVAALVHDWLTSEFDDQEIDYSSQGYFKAVINPSSNQKDYVDWNQAAAILREIMLKSGAKAWKRQCVYLAVRLYGLIKQL